jgi:hypothetical protein
MKIEVLFPYLLADVPGVPDVTAKQALLLSTIEFCVHTHAWDEIQDPVTLSDAVNEYDVDVPQDARVVAIKNIWTAAKELTPVTMSQLQQAVPNWQVATSNIPMYYNAPADLGSFRVYPIPTNAMGLAITLRAAYAPTLSAASVPDSVINRYLESIVSGAKYRLMATPGKGWSNAPLAAYHQQRFDEGVNRAKIDILHDKTQGSLKIKPVRFGF